MSAIANFRIIETSKLSQLRDNAEVKIEKKLFGNKVIDHYWDYLNSNLTETEGLQLLGISFCKLINILS